MHVAEWCEPILHIYGIVRALTTNHRGRMYTTTLHTCNIDMANTLQHGVNQHCMHVAEWCEPILHIYGIVRALTTNHRGRMYTTTLHTCNIDMANTLQHGVNQHCLTKAHPRWSSSCFSHRHSLLVVCVSQNGVNRYCISMVLSEH